ncbi:hypothetical protein CRYUN_Cryun30bG0023200 [Craigia yunnanensis]
MVAVGEGDVDGGALESFFEEWSEKVVTVLKGGLVVENANGIVYESDVESLESDDDDDGGGGGGGEIVDLEDIAGKGPSRKKSVNVAETNWKLDGKREMVIPVIRANLEKQGYKIIGSHSGVKICRWTKSQLRGGGGCYKHSFYGIESHRCMEATPSLACANKCVFCWRHHTNPVAKSWQWKMDDPLEIVNTAIDLHTKMINQMKGVPVSATDNLFDSPHVLQERLLEGLFPRHCALSLVGEPIMYPEINMLVDELHRRRISTFLVTNAQFPEKIKMLKPITQDSLKALKEKHQQTVYHLTLVKGWNTEDLDAYSKLFSIGKPGFVEIKRVTYCGSSATSNLTMENVPWHSDVKAFSEALALKSEENMRLHVNMHTHAVSSWQKQKSSRSMANGQWYTWIDYEKFHDLVASGRPFDSEDYMAFTPSWAVYGADEGGFDPDQSRYRKERHHNSNH